MTNIHRVLQAAYGTTWAILPEKLEAIRAFLEIRADGHLSAEEIQAAVGSRRTAPSQSSSGSIAVLPLFGVIGHRMGSMANISGGTSVERFTRRFNEAVADENVAAIVIDVDSPGGAVPGVGELAQQVHGARGKKPIIAVANSLMASAAYWIASAADEVVAIPSADVGSIGVFMIHSDMSRRDDREGITRTIIQAGKYKTEGSPYAPLSEEARERLQGIVDDTYGRFVAAVAQGRGVPGAQVRDGFGQGRVLPAKQALAEGLVDRIATMDEVLAELAGGRVRRKPQMQRASADGITVLPVAALRAATGPDTMVVQTISAETGEVVGETEYALRAKANDDRTELLDAGGAASAQDIPPRPTAPEAKEEAVDPKTDTAAQNGAATLDLGAERARVQELMKMGTEYKVEAAQVERWIEAGVSVNAASREILSTMRERDKAKAAEIRVGETREATKPFASLGEQLMSVVSAARAGVDPDPRLLRLNAAAGSTSTVPSDGGFLIQQDFTSEILRRTYEIGQLSSRVRRVPIGANANGLKVRAVDESSRATGSRYGGVQVYWEGEGETPEAKKPKFRQMELNLRKLIGLWYATDEILQDAVALEAVGTDAFAEEINFMVEDAIVRGTGGGQPLGILNSGALVTVAKESSQSAAGVVAQNVVNMFARLWSRSRLSAAWFINQDVEPQLQTMTLGDQPIYLPPGGLRDTPYGTLLGRPVIPVEYCETMGTVGDILLADLSQYLMIDKGGVNQAWSIHVRFIYDEQTFRITYRCDGQPVWNKPLTPYKGSNTLSPFVALAARP